MRGTGAARVEQRRPIPARHITTCGARYGRTARPCLSARCVRLGRGSRRKLRNRAPGTNRVGVRRAWRSKLRNRRWRHLRVRTLPRLARRTATTPPRFAPRADFAAPGTRSAPNWWPLISRHSERCCGCTPRAAGVVVRQASARKTRAARWRVLPRNENTRVAPDCRAGICAATRAGAQASPGDPAGLSAATRPRRPGLRPRRCYGRIRICSPARVRYSRI